MMEPTPKAAKFTAANQKSLVIIGVVQPGGGAWYRLEDRREFTLSLADVQSMPMPKWKLS
jgi:hypothetical protein